MRARNGIAHATSPCFLDDEGGLPTEHRIAKYVAPLVPFVVPVAVTFGMTGLASCGEEVEEPPELECADGIDNEGDGAIDCADEDCWEDIACTDLYGAVFEDDCSNGIDDDLDGSTDCVDADCFIDLACPQPAYGVPFEADCGDGEDNDGDGLMDCDDSDCADHSACSD